MPKVDTVLPLLRTLVQAQQVCPHAAPPAPEAAVGQASLLSACTLSVIEQHAVLPSLLWKGMRY